MNSKIKILIIVILVVALVCGIFFLAKNKSSKPGKYDALANALTQSGAKFYGAFWCPHCQKEKAWFGTSAKLLPYVECSNPDHTQTQICIDKKIAGYPTWIFADGTIKTGEITPEDLAKQINFVLQ